MQFKTLRNVAFLLILIIGCNKPFIEPEAINHEQPQSATLKAAVIGTKYYVSKTGSNSNLGTLLSPFLTIQKGLDVAIAGDSVFVKAGTYQEYVTFNKSGTTVSPIVLKNYAKDVVLIDAQSTRVYCIYAKEKSNLVVDGFSVINSANYNIQFSGCESVIVKNVNCTLLQTSTAKNIVINPSINNWGKNITIQNATTSGGTYGIYIGNRLNSLKIIGGRYSYASIDGINLQAGSESDSTKFNRNILVDGAQVDHNSRQGIVTWGIIKSTFKKFWAHHNGGQGVQIENKSSQIRIEDFVSEYNSLGHDYTGGIWIDDSDSVTVRRGIIRYNQTGFRVTNSKNVLAYNLIIHSNSYTRIANDISNNSSGICFDSNPIGANNDLYLSHVELYNSVLYNNSNIYSQRGSVDLEGSGTYILKNNIISYDKSKSDIFRTGSNTLISDNNLIYNTRAISIYFNPTTAYKLPITWNSYKTATGQDAHSINANPQFVSGDLKLLSTSPAINAGVNVGLRSDYLGKAYNGLPDIGAYEF